MGSAVFSSSYRTNIRGTQTYNVRITYSETYSASTNKTSVKITGVELQLPGNDVNWGILGFFGSIKVAGTTLVTMNGVGCTVSLSGSNYCAISGMPASSSVDVSHNNDGTGSFTMELVGGFTYGDATYFCALYRGSPNEPFGVKAQSKSVSLTARGYTLTTAVSPSGYGTVTSGATLAQNKTKSLTATPASTTAQYSYAFSKWTVSGTGASLSSTTAATTTFTMGSANATVTATFTRTTRSYTVTCEDRIGSSSGTKLGSKTASYSYGSSVSGASFGSDTTYDKYYTGYHYTGSSSAITVDGAETVYRYFALNTWTVAYNANGGTGAPSSQTKTYNTALTLSSTKPSKSNSTVATYTVTYNYNGNGSSNTTATSTKTRTFTFSKWNTASDGSGTNYSSGGSYTANSGATLYAQYSSSDSTSAVTLPTPTRSGYAFAGWYTAASGGTKIGNGGASYTPTATITLYAQWSPQVSTVSAANGNFGSAVTITISRNDSSFTHTIKTSCAGYSETLMTKGSTYPTVSWTPALATYGPRLTTSMSATATITCETYSGNTLIGTSTATCTLSFTAASVKPSTSIAVADPNGYLTTYGAFVKGKSKIRVTLTNTLKYSATLKTITITANGSTYTSSPATTDVIASTSNTSVTAKITDSRNQTSDTATSTITILDYSSPKINSFSVYRCNSDGSSNNTGAFMRVNYNVTITALNDHNSKILQIKYKKISASSWTSYYSGSGTTLSAYSASGNVHDIPADLDSSYDVVLEVKDDFTTTTSAKICPTAATHINHGAGQNGGIGIGKVSENDKTIEIASDWRIFFNGSDTHLTSHLFTEVESVDETVMVSFPAGTIGTRGFQKKLDATAPNGKKIVGTAVTYIQDSSTLIPILFSTGSDLYFNAYRATSSAVSNIEVHVRFTFAEF